MNEQNEAREEIFAKHISNKGFVSTICKEFINTIVKRQPNLKIGKRNLNRHFTKEDALMAKTHLKRCLLSIDTKKMKIKIMMTYHHTPTGLVRLKRLTISNVSEDMDQIEFTYVAGRSVKVTTSGEVAISDSQTDYLPYDSEVLLLRI